MLGAICLIIFVVGSAGGFVLGHRQGKSDDKRELAEAQDQSRSLNERVQASDVSIGKLQTERDNLKAELSAARQDSDAKLAAARQAEDAAVLRAKEAEKKLEDRAATDVAEVERRRNEETRKAEASKKVQAARNNPTKVLFKDFANFPEEYVGCVRFENVWLDGDFERVEGSKDFSPGVSSRDGKHIFGRRILRFADGAIFVISEEIGRPLSVTFESNKKYAVNLCCEVTKNDKQSLTRIYRVETLTIGGDVKDVFEEK